jgi:hypothetical protein
MAISAREQRPSDTAFQLDHCEDFGFDLVTGRFWWSKQGTSMVEAKATAVGSVSMQTGTWLWSWANPFLKEVAMDEIQRVRTFGREQGILKLTVPRWPADEADGWEMAAVSAKLLNGEIVYRCPMKDILVFFVLRGLYGILAR